MTTKKDFIAAAKEIKAMQNREEAAIVAESLANIFSKQNIRFDYNRFYSACDVNIIKL